MSRWFCTRHPPIHRASYCRDGKIAELGLVRLVYDCLTPLEEFASGKWFGEEAREVLVTFDVRYDNLVIFHYLAGDEMTPLHVLELRVVLWIIGSVDRSFTIEVKSRRFGFASCEFVVERADCLLYTSPSPRDVEESRMPSSA